MTTASAVQPKRAVRHLRASQVKPRPVQWLWPGRLPLGAITVLVGEPGLGKSLLTTTLAAQLSRGELTGTAETSLFLTAEDSEALVGALQRSEQELLQQLADREREAAAAADDPLERLLQDHGVRGIAWRAAQLPTDQHRDKVAEWLDMLLESVKRPES